MVALAEPDSTLTLALLSPEIQASRRTIAAPAGLDVEARVPLDQPLPVAVEMLEQLMVRRALTAHTAASRKPRGSLASHAKDCS